VPTPPPGSSYQVNAGTYVATPRVRRHDDSGRVYDPGRGYYPGERSRYDQENAYAAAPPPSASYYDNYAVDSHREEGLINKAHRYGETVVHFGETVVNKTERAARRIGGWFQKKFTGQDTISPEATGEIYDQNPASPDRYSYPVRPEPPE
jgi:hypothetical protein